MTHELKTERPYFQDVKEGTKQFEVRKCDRFFQKGDRLLLREFNNGQLTGRTQLCEVTYMLQGGKFGIADDHCVLGIKNIK